MVSLNFRSTFAPEDKSPIPGSGRRAGRASRSDQSFDVDKWSGGPPICSRGEAGLRKDCDGGGLSGWLARKYLAPLCCDRADQKRGLSPRHQIEGRKCPARSASKGAAGHARATRVACRSTLSRAERPAGASATARRRKDFCVVSEDVRRGRYANLGAARVGAHGGRVNDQRWHAPHARLKGPNSLSRA